MPHSSSWQRPWQGADDQVDDYDLQVVVGLCPLCPSQQGGEVIAKLRSETDARIKMEDRVPGCDERVISISSPDEGYVGWGRGDGVMQVGTEWVVCVRAEYIMAII